MRRNNKHKFNPFKLLLDYNYCDISSKSNYVYGSGDGSVGIASRLHSERRRNRVSVSGTAKKIIIFSLKRDKTTSMNLPADSLSTERSLAKSKPEGVRTRTLFPMQRSVELHNIRHLNGIGRD
jgi:hypothetical protein